ncbi:cell division protein ZapA [Ectothiorhodospira variabilis]|uniref:cell division protein ZapA n=1 Tax=Ectothiorhodospira variabilis TaxID=505694 RepID=UPI001EFA6F13|nr:cell division protein ZapA [Ectothiorhodospira variabilis]MCG5494443.1 cell division protein ZapA [Ectothiorhodospira variabilis]MCG5498910.1 cell division protein ZapA [Ectothiorhodospira variabilis]MCG5503186.1 cell division protein ZapA [Ectothiorhodospira variabilis]MCG5506055.1 cell division protein ZapA [Ectothiorhodospira variabilis]
MTETVAEPVTVQILGKEYRVACPEEQRHALIASANLLDRRMKEIRDTGKVVGGDRIAVMAALNITHELLTLKDQQADVDKRIQALRARVDSALDKEAEGH